MRKLIFVCLLSVFLFSAAKKKKSDEECTPPEEGLYEIKSMAPVAGKKKLELVATSTGQLKEIFDGFYVGEATMNPADTSLGENLSGGLSATFNYKSCTLTGMLYSFEISNFQVFEWSIADKTAISGSYLQLIGRTDFADETGIHEVSFVK